MSKFFNWLFLGLLIFTPLALLAASLHFPPLATFILAAIAIIPLSKYIGDATEEISNHTNSGLGGFLNATFGNATELIVGIFALQAGLIDVVKASITGSVMGNLLLVLGMAIFAGGYKREKQTFSPTLAKAGGSLLLLATIALVIPALFQATSPSVLPITVMQLSLFVAVLMIFAYAAQLIFTLHTHKHLSIDEQDINVVGEGNQWGVNKSIFILGAATIAVTFVSNALVGSITPLIQNFGWTELFIGAIIIAIVGNAAEHVSAIQAAVRDKMDLALAITVGSATQVIMFVAPVLVIVSQILGRPMNLVFDLFELIALIFTVFVANSVIEDGESNWFEGVQLLVAYAIIAVAFFLHP